MDLSAVGSEGTSFELRVELGKVREFARAVKCDDGRYLTGDDPVIPPTFLTSGFHWELDVPDANPWALLHVDQKRGLHAEQEYIFYGPPPKAGARLRARSKIAKAYEKQGRRGGTLTFAVMITEFFDEHGKLVAEARMTGVETGKPPERTGE